MLRTHRRRRLPAAAGGAQPYTFPPEFITDCLNACPALDSETVIGGGAVIVQNTVQVINPDN